MKNYPSAPSFGKIAERQLIFLDFYNESDSKEYDFLISSVGEAIYQATIKKYSYVRIENQTWRHYVRINRFKPSDFFDRTKIQMMGSAMPADGVIFGKFVVTPNGIKISGRILSVLSREIIAESERTVLHSQDIPKEVKILADQLSDQLAELFMPSDRGAIWRSALFPGWGQFYKRRETAGKIYSGAVGTGFAFSLFSLVLWQTAYSRYRNYNPDHVFTPQGGTELIDPATAQVEFNRLASQTQTWQQMTLISAGITFTIYLWQILDAWLFDTKHAQLGRRVAALDTDVFIGFGLSNADSRMQQQSLKNPSETFLVNVGLSF